MIQRYLSSRLLPELRDPRLGFATVTGVEVTSDLKSARVFVTIYEQDAVRKKGAIDALNGAAGRFRRDLGRGLSLRYAPVLIFVEDASVARGDRIERLIRNIHQERDETPGDESE